MRVIVLFICCVASSFSYSEGIVLGIAQTTVQQYGQKIEQISNVLAQGNDKISIRIFPDERVLHLAAKGEIAGVLFRQDMAMTEFSHMLQVPTALDQLDIWLITTQDKAEFCNEHANQRAKRVFIGVIGIRFFTLFSQRFPNYLEVEGGITPLKMLAYGRGDFTAWPEQLMSTAQSILGTKLHKCGPVPSYSLHFYTYLHPDYGQWRDTIDQIYQEAGY